MPWGHEDPGFRPLSDRAADLLAKDMDRLHAAAGAAKSGTRRG